MDCGYTGDSVRLILWILKKEDLPHLFPEFVEVEHECKFRECSDQHEPNCAVIAGVESGDIWQERYDHYLSFYEELDQRKTSI